MRPAAIASTLVLLLFASSGAAASSYPRFTKRDDFKLTVDNKTDVVLQPSLAGDFADPGIIHGDDGRWYAFATNGDGVHVPMAAADEPLGEWTRLAGDAMPAPGWTNGTDTWAPDVRRLADGTYIMYFAGRMAGARHCIGTARSPNVTGPYVPDPEPFTCHLDAGGSIDAAGFLDERTGKRYVTYKIDGNAIGNGGSCGNTVKPIVDTPLKLQEVDADDGSTPIGSAVTLLDLDPDEDGPVIEAPDIVLVGGVYVLFFSAGCYDGDGYKVKYAYASDVAGPYTRAPEPLLQTADLGLVGPGGATGTDDGTLVLALHGYCGAVRCMYVVEYEVEH